ncbi:MAG TPA: hypothetical protein IAC09_05725 [Candidatus Cryptobacteroides intestinipullorum]|nr:hypothetical protein [Candidatus Cryptobacteroides intestinipullorum]
MGIRSGHGQTFFKGDTITALPSGGRLFRNNHYPVTVRMMMMVMTRMPA